MTPASSELTVAERVKTQAHAAWRRGYVREALPEAVVALLLVIAAWLLTSQRALVVMPALAFLGLTAVFISVPHASRRLVLPALLLGTIPLGCALVAQALGHHCGGESCATSCATWCAPLCATGGLASGVLLARAARYEPRPWRAWLLGGGLIISAGALGCGCVGAAGIVGLALGFLPSAGLLVGARGRG